MYNFSVSYFYHFWILYNKNIYGYLKINNNFKVTIIQAKLKVTELYSLLFLHSAINKKEVILPPLPSSVDSRLSGHWVVRIEAEETQSQLRRWWVGQTTCSYLSLSATGPINYF